MARSIGTANIITPGYVCHSPRLGLYGLVTGYGRLYCDYHGWGGEFPKTQIIVGQAAGDQQRRLRDGLLVS